MREPVPSWHRTSLCFCPLAGRARTGLALIVSLVAVTTLFAQPPRFRLGVDVIEVDVQVVDRAGNPVTDLRPDDVAVEVDGHPRRLLAVELESFEKQSSRTRGGVASDASRVETPAPADYVSNVSAPKGRLFVLVVDRGNMTRGGGRGAMEAASRFLDRLTAGDQVALVTVPVGPSVELTGDHALVKTALERVVGGASELFVSAMGSGVSLAEAFAYVTGSRPQLWSTAVGEECQHSRGDMAFQMCRTRLEHDAAAKVEAARQSRTASAHALQNLFRRLEAIEGPKYMVLIGQSLVTGAYFGSFEGLGDFGWLGPLAQSARVHLYVLQFGNAFLEAFDVSERHPSRTLIDDANLLDEGLGQVAGLAGGALFHLTSALDPAFDRVARETSMNYLVRFALDASDLDGKRHKIGVRVARPNVEVRARREFIAARAEPGDSGSAVAPHDRLVRVLGSPLLPAAVPIEMTSYVVGDPGSADMRLLIASTFGCGGTASPPVVVGLEVVDAQGKRVRVSDGSLPSTVLSGDGRECLYYREGFRVPPGSYTVRLAVVDQLGRAGGIERHVQARFATDTPFGLGDVVLADPARRVAGRMMLLVDGTVLGQELSVYVDVAPRTPPKSPSLEPTRPVPTLRFEIAPNTSSDAVVAVTATVTPDPGTGRWFGEAVLGLDRLTPGSYQVRALTLVDDAVVARSTRAIRITK